MAAARQQSLPTSIPGARQRHQPGLQCSSGTSCRQELCRRFSFDAGAVVFPFTDKRFRSEVSGGATDVGSRYREFEDILFFRPQDIRYSGCFASCLLSCDGRRGQGRGAPLGSEWRGLCESHMQFFREEDLSSTSFMFQPLTSVCFFLLYFAS